MSRVIQCPECGKKLRVPPAGGVFNCPGCSKKMRIKGSSDADSGSAAKPKVAPAPKAPASKAAAVPKAPASKPAPAPKAKASRTYSDDEYDDLLDDDYGDEYEDEYDDMYDDEPRRRSSRSAQSKKKSGSTKPKKEVQPEPKKSNVGLIIGVSAGAGLAILGLVIGMLVMSGGDEEENPGGQGAALAATDDTKLPADIGDDTKLPPDIGEDPPHEGDPNGRDVADMSSDQRQDMAMREEDRMRARERERESERDRPDNTVTSRPDNAAGAGSQPNRPDTFTRTENPTPVQRAREATALIVTPRGTCSAFCIHESGVFITDSRAVRSYTSSALVKIVLNSGQKEETVFDALVGPPHKSTNLAVVTIKDGGKGGPFAALDLGAADKLQETDEVFVYGYPRQRGLQLDKQNGPSIAAKVGRVISLQREQARLTSLRINASLGVGNFGGPVVTKDGTVVAVATVGRISRSNEYVMLPAEKVTAMIQEPIVDFATPDSVTSEELTKERVISASVKTIGTWLENPPQYTASVTVKAENERTVELKKGEDGKFTASIPLVKPVREDIVRFTGAFDSGDIEGVASDTTIVAKDKVLKLSAIAQMTRQGNGHYVVTVRGSKRKIIGKLRATDLRSVEVQVAGKKQAMDLTKARKLVFPGPTIPTSVELVLDIKGPGGDKLASVSRSVFVDAGDTADEAGAGGVTVADNGGSTRRPGRSTGATRIRAPDRKLAESKKVQLPGEVTDICFGASGRYMICLIPKTQQAAIIDLAIAKVIKYIAMPSADVKIAAGARKLVVAIPDKNIVSRYDLGSFRKELTKEVELEGSIGVLCMGCASSGPIYVGAGGRSSRSQPKFLSLKSFREENLEWPEKSNYFRLGNHVRASADGQTFISSGSSSGYSIFQVQGNKIAKGYNGNSSSLPIVSPDGTVVYTYYGPVAVELNNKSAPRSGNRNSRGISFPALHGNIYARMNGYSYGSSSKPKVTLHIQGSKDKVATLPDTDELFKTSGRRYTNSPGFLTFEKRIVIAPALGIVALTFQDYIEVRPFDLIDIIKNSGVDYLVVVSAPVTKVKAGSMYQYPIKVLSKAGRVKMKLDSGPDGMKLDSRGVLKWKTNGRDKGENYTVIVTVSDGSGSESLHTFKLNIE